LRKGTGLEPVKVGVIGCGTVAETCHLPAAVQIPELRIEALADINEENAGSLASKFDLDDPLIYTDYRRLLREADVDAVWILTPPKLHARMVIDSLNQGKHVLCEKPLATTLEESEAIKKALRKLGENGEHRILMPAHNFIFTPCYGRAHKLLEEGAIGRLNRITGYITTNLSFYKAKTDFRMQAKGGVIEDILPHLMYLSQDIAGPLTEVSSLNPRVRGRSIIHDVEVDVKLRGLEGEVEASLSAAWSSFVPTLKLELMGERGRISMDLLRTPYNLTMERGDGEVEKYRMGRRILQYLDVFRGRHPSYLNEHKHFINLVRGECNPRVTVEDGLNLVTMLNKVLSKLDEGVHLQRGREVVSIVRVEDNLIDEAVRRAIKYVGGFRFRRNAKVVVKPNVCFKRNTDNMIITDPRVLGSVLSLLRERTNRILVVESDNNSGRGDIRVKKTGVMDVIEDHGAEFINLSDDEYEEHNVSDVTIKIPKTILEAEYLVNMPKIKTCNIANMIISISMKNMFGILSDKKKMRLHKRLVEVLLYINKRIRQDLIIVDGVVAMEGLGPVWGSPVNLNLIVSGLNPVSVDAVCCNIMGINPYSVEVLWRAYRDGMGQIDIEKITVLGEDMNDVKRRFAYPTFITKNVVGAIRTALKTYL